MYNIKSYEHPGLWNPDKLWMVFSMKQRDPGFCLSK